MLQFLSVPDDSHAFPESAHPVTPSRYSKTILSKGRYAELLADSRSFTADELTLFDAAAEHAYESFRDKAALSRGMEIEAMQEVAQVRRAGCIRPSLKWAFPHNRDTV